MSGIGLGDGYAHAYDHTYREDYLVAAQKLNVKADIHEFEMVGNGTAIVTAYELRAWDLSPFMATPQMVSRPGYIKDSIFQEIDLETNEVIFQWRASDHINMGDSYSGLSSPSSGSVFSTPGHAADLGPKTALPCPFPTT